MKIRHRILDRVESPRKLRADDCELSNRDNSKRKLVFIMVVIDVLVVVVTVRSRSSSDNVFITLVLSNFNCFDGFVTIESPTTFAPSCWASSLYQIEQLRTAVRWRRIPRLVSKFPNGHLQLHIVL